MPPRVSRGRGHRGSSLEWFGHFVRLDIFSPIVVGPLFTGAGLLVYRAAIEATTPMEPLGDSRCYDHRLRVAMVHTVLHCTHTTIAYFP